MGQVINLAFRLVRPVLHAMDAERAHCATIAALRRMPLQHVQHDGALAVSCFGLSFPNPLGLAAGFDKNADVPDQMLGFGFGFVEVGTTTPLPQAGNPRPRLFRLAEDRAVINRMGFNNEGHDAMEGKLGQRQRQGLVGVNIGANKDSADRIGDYVKGVERFGAVASYLTVNISSPNTPGLRGLQSQSELAALLSRLNAARARLARPVPMLLKIAPDLTDGEMEDIAACCAGQVDGVIISNTTISRPELASRHAAESGGLSGQPLFDLSTRQLAKFFLMSGGGLPLVGAGGVSDAATAWRKLEAGASLVQLYSALVYAGPALVMEITQGLKHRLKASGASSLAEITGSKARDIASLP